MTTLTNIKKIIQSNRLNYGDNAKPIEICSKCGEPLQMDITILGEKKRVGIACKCTLEEMKARQEQEENEKLTRSLNRFRAYSLMDKNFEVATFENWKFKDDNKRLFEFGKRYCERWETMQKNNRGLLIHGASGNGKSFLSFAIANELNRKGITVLAISVSRILNLIQDSYRSGSDNIGEIQILDMLNEVSLLILDDLGTESRTKWAYEKLYAIIDGRYRSKQPLIITTNLNDQELRKNLQTVDFKSGIIDREERIYNRLVEICSPLEVKGSSWRKMKGVENAKNLMRELGFV